MSSEESRSDDTWSFWSTESSSLTSPSRATDHAELANRQNPWESKSSWDVPPPYVPDAQNELWNEVVGNQIPEKGPIRQLLNVIVRHFESIFNFHEATKISFSDDDLISHETALADINVEVTYDTAVHPITDDFVMMEADYLNQYFQNRIKKSCQRLKNNRGVKGCLQDFRLRLVEAEMIHNVNDLIRNDPFVAARDSLQDKRGAKISEDINGPISYETLLGNVQNSLQVKRDEISNDTDKPICYETLIMGARNFRQRWEASEFSDGDGETTGHEAAPLSSRSFQERPQAAVTSHTADFTTNRNLAKVKYLRKDRKGDRNTVSRSRARRRTIERPKKRIQELPEAHEVNRNLLERDIEGEAPSPVREIPQGDGTMTGNVLPDGTAQTQAQLNQASGIQALQSPTTALRTSVDGASELPIGPIEIKDTPTGIDIWCGSVVIAVCNRPFAKDIISGLGLPFRLALRELMGHSADVATNLQQYRLMLSDAIGRVFILAWELRRRLLCGSPLCSSSGDSDEVAEGSHEVHDTSVTTQENMQEPAVAEVARRLETWARACRVQTGSVLQDMIWGEALIKKYLDHSNPATLRALGKELPFYIDIMVNYDEVVPDYNISTVRVRRRPPHDDEEDEDDAPIGQSNAALPIVSTTREGSDVFVPFSSAAAAPVTVPNFATASLAAPEPVNFQPLRRSSIFGSTNYNPEVIHDVYSIIPESSIRYPHHYGRPSSPSYYPPPLSVHTVDTDSDRDVNAYRISEWINSLVNLSPDTSERIGIEPETLSARDEAPTAQPAHFPSLPETIAPNELYPPPTEALTAQAAIARYNAYQTLLSLAEALTSHRVREESPPPLPPAAITVHDALARQIPPPVEPYPLSDTRDEAPPFPTPPAAAPALPAATTTIADALALRPRAALLARTRRRSEVSPEKACGLGDGGDGEGRDWGKGDRERGLGGERRKKMRTDEGGR